MSTALQLPAQAAPARGRPSTRGWSAARTSRALLVAFVLVESTVVLLRLSGPSFDEAIYATAGLRTLDGEGITDNYLSWFSGSLLWPTMSGAAHEVGGLVGSRLLALAMVTTGVWATGRAAANLLGPRTQAWTVALLVTSAPVLRLGVLAEYDVVAVAGLGLTLWALSELVVRDDRRWLAAAAGAACFAVLGKYPVVFSALAALGVLSLRRHRVRLDLVLLSLWCGSLMLAYFLPLRDRLAQFPAFRAANNPDFGATLASTALRLTLDGLPVLVLALVGAWTARRAGRRLVLGLLAGMLVWPAYHLLVAGNAVGASKHVVLGLLCVAPLAAHALATLAHRTGPVPALLLVGGLLVLAVHQLAVQRAEWPDTRAGSAYLAQHVQPGDTLLVDDAWPYRLPLVAAGLVDGPFDVYDGYNVTHGGQGPSDVCGVEWFVQEEPSSFPWDARTREQVQDCGTFARVWTGTDTVRNLEARSLLHVDYTVTTEVWRNLSPRPGG